VILEIDIFPFLNKIDKDNYTVAKKSQLTMTLFFSLI